MRGSGASTEQVTWKVCQLDNTPFHTKVSIGNHLVRVYYLYTRQVVEQPGIRVVAQSVVDNSESSYQALKRAGLADLDQPIKGLSSQRELIFLLFSLKLVSFPPPTSLEY